MRPMPPTPPPLPLLNFIIGRLGAPHGVRGWMKVHSFMDLPADIFNYQPWYIKAEKRPETTWQLVEFADYKAHAEPFLVKLKGIDSPEAARLLTQHLIAIPRSQLPTLKKDEYYWSDLVGLTVIDQQQKVLGKVSYLMETGSNDVMVVKGEKEIAIPFLLHDVVTNIDLERGEMHVVWSD